MAFGHTVRSPDCFFEQLQQTLHDALGLLPSLAASLEPLSCIPLAADHVIRAALRSLISASHFCPFLVLPQNKQAKNKLMQASAAELRGASFMAAYPSP